MVKGAISLIVVAGAGLIIVWNVIAMIRTRRNRK